jgi:DNA-binding NarL/FixJ family response regulator
MSKHNAVACTASAFNSVLVLEDDMLMQQRLHRILHGCGAARDAIRNADTLSQARELIDRHAFSLILVDIGLPDGNGIDLIADMRRDHPLLDCVVVSAWSAQTTIVSALRAGAIGYILKEREDAEIEYCLRCIERGGAPIDPFIAKHILQLIGAPASPALPQPLSKREQHILLQVSQGLSNGEIAERLSLSKLTVESHTRNIYRKLAVKSRSAAVHQARSHGWLR